MKLLFTTLNDHVTWGGSEELWFQTLLKIHSDFDITVLVKRWEDEVAQIKTLEDLGVKILYKDIKSKKISFPQRVINKLKYKSNQTKSIINFNNYDHIFISLGNNFDHNLFQLTDKLNLLKIPYSLIIQLATDLRNINDYLLDKFVTAYEASNTVFFLSEDNILKTELLLGIELKNKKKINNPFNYNQQYIAPQSNKFNMACVAAFTSFHKGQDLLITVLGQEKWKSRDFVLNLYGDGINKKQIERLIKRYNLKDKVALKGFVANKEDIWLKNTVCIMPSRMEGQSLAMLEAMSYGRMIIATNVGDAKRLIIENKTGFLIEAPTLELIDRALEKAWKNKDSWIDYGINSRQHLYDTIKIDPVLDFSNQIRKYL
jgi:glycosyltransferase involved in cell wall biosynthesis